MHCTGRTSTAGEVSVVRVATSKVIMEGRPLRNGHAPSSSKRWTFPLSSACRYYVGYNNVVMRVEKSQVVNPTSLSNWGGGLQMWVRSGKVVKVLATS